MTREERQQIILAGVKREAFVAASELREALNRIAALPKTVDAGVDADVAMEIVRVSRRRLTDVQAVLAEVENPERPV